MAGARARMIRHFFFRPWRLFHHHFLLVIRILLAILGLAAIITHFAHRSQKAR